MSLITHLYEPDINMYIYIYILYRLEGGEGHPEKYAYAENVHLPGEIEPQCPTWVAAL
jgi:hypothetical protein